MPQRAVRDREAGCRASRSGRPSVTGLARSGSDARTGPTPADQAQTRVFLGFLEVAAILSDMAGMLRERGHDVEGIVFENRFYASPDPALRRLAAPAWFKSPRLRTLWLQVRLILLFPAILLRHRLFIFVWSVTFLPFNLDLLLLRLFRRKVIIFNCGDDARYRPIHDRLDCEVLGFNWLGDDEEARRDFLGSGNSFVKTLWFQKIQEWSGVQIVSSRNLATFQGVTSVLFRMPQRQLISAPKPTNPVPLLVHAPSNRSIKGTKLVLAAVERLRAEGLRFEFRLIENMTNAQVLDTLRQADIAVDQVYGAWPGRFGFEALAAGCVLVGGYRPDYCGYPERLPVVEFEPDAGRLTDSLRRLIIDANERQRLMAESWECWRKHSSPDATYAWYRRLIDGTAESFDPLPDHKGHLLRFAPKAWQRLLIRWLY
jgi:hypothetical protein